MAAFAFGGESEVSTNAVKRQAVGQRVIMNSPPLSRFGDGKLKYHGILLQTEHLKVECCQGFFRGISGSTAK